jgi:hypothetical protein
MKPEPDNVPVTYLYTFEINKPRVPVCELRVLSESYELAREFCLNFAEKHQIRQVSAVVHKPGRRKRVKDA